MSRKWLLPLLFAAPLLLTLLWGAPLAAPALSLAAQARALAAGTLTAPLAAPLYTAVLALLIRLGLNPLDAALLLGALGWGCAALALAQAGRVLGWPWAGLAAGALLAFSPAVVTSAGRPFGWISAAFWLAFCCAWARRWGCAALAALALGAFFLTWPPGLRPPPGLAAPLLWSALLLAACVGLSALAARRAPAATAAPTAARVLALVFLLLAGWQLLQLNSALRARPLAAERLAGEVAAWLGAETPTEATLLAPAALGLRAGRATTAVPDPPPLDLPTQLADALAAGPVDYVVAGDSLPWELLREALWFRLAYAPLRTFRAPGGAPALTVYAHRPPHPDLGPRRALNARVPDRLAVLGTQLGPEVAAPGDAPRLLLALQAPAATILPRAPFEAVVRLVSPLDNATLAEWTAVLPAALAPGAVSDEIIPLPLPPDLPGGGYQLNLSLRDGPGAEFWPFSFNNDVNRLDRVPLGWLAVPQDAPPPAQALDIPFADGIALRGVTIGTAVPGADLPVTLYWAAAQTPDVDYAVFVHLLDAEGALVAGSDGRPANGRFPAPAWHPGLTVADAHALPLPPDLPPGNYTLHAGLYDPASGARLPLAAGGDAAPLGRITID